MNINSIIKKSLIAIAYILFSAINSLAQSPALTEKGKQAAFGNLKVVSQYGHVVFADQPDEETIGMMKDQGIGLILNIRGEAEDEGFDEREVVEKLGMSYIQIPYMKGRGIDLGSMNEIIAVINATGENGTKMMLHCTHSQRAGSLLSAVLYRDYGVSKEDAMKIASDAGLTSEFLAKMNSEFLDTLK
ncbi:MAG: hypothetical protein P8J14_06555 [Emcibacteraceae bacterium]|nr:hypothetical protein [Emcibacteraceae bacterium]